ncbi:MAG: zinc-ribbon domain-containing protein [Eubacteriales bacterium]|nr:zinc-ribbon domain-containing protein [Eubacteriales bacterium]
MEKYYCPKCFALLDKYEGCGSIGYFCNTCKILISRSKMLSYEQMTAATQTPTEDKTEERSDI